ncbi:MAG: HAD family hydrolase, partial [Deltaproteobacteria bacterium]|nr:HAD family hydrolase [Deltaproteobacteria bacterium]
FPFFQQLELLFPGNSVNSASAEQFENMKLEGFFNERLSGEVRETLAYLRGKGIFVAVSSNNFQELVEKFVKRENAVYFDEVLGARENFFKGKDHFDYMKERYYLNEHDILFIGDSLKDAEKAVSCGIAFVAKLGTFRQSDFRKLYPDVMTINSISDLKGIVL